MVLYLHDKINVAINLMEITKGIVTGASVNITSYDMHLKLSRKSRVSLKIKN